MRKTKDFIIEKLSQDPELRKIHLKEAVEEIKTGTPELGIAMVTDIIESLERIINDRP